MTPYKHPDNVPIELQVIASCMDPETIGEVMLRLTPSHFGNESTGRIFSRVRSMSLENYAITPESIALELELQDGMAREEAIQWVSSISDAAPMTRKNLPFMVKALSTMRIRQLTDELGRHLCSASGAVEPIDSTLDRIAGFQRALNSLDGETAQTYLEDLREIAQGRKKQPYLVAGLGPLDKIYRIRAGSMNIIGADSGGGKTALLLNMAANIAKSGAHVGVIEIEMNRRSIASRLAGIYAGVDTMRVGDDELTALERETIGYHVEQAAESIDRVHGIEPSAIAVDRIHPIVSRWKEEFNVQVVLIDYIQRIKAGGRGIVTTTDRVSHVSETLTEIAKATNIPLVCLAQLRRDEGKKGMSHLKHSAQLEHDGHTIGILTAEAGQDPRAPVRRVIFSGEKNREGSLWNDILNFELHSQRFTHSGQIVHRQVKAQEDGL